MELEELNTREEFTVALSKAGDRTVFVIFLAKWCDPCKAIDPKYEEFAKRFSNIATFYKVLVCNQDTMQSTRHSAA